MNIATFGILRLLRWYIAYTVNDYSFFFIFFIYLLLLNRSIVIGSELILVKTELGGYSWRKMK